MCGIAGMIGLSPQREAADRMLATMSRRGPDAQNSFFDKGCCLLHSRLAIIDPEGGAQPMELTWGGETYIIVYNGELYNTNAVRQLLERLGHRFLGHSDTEVVLHAYAQWAEACVEKFNGIFAFGVWEQKRKRLFLARDRIGVKPLFYKLHEGGLLFASELKTVLACPGVRACLDAEGVTQIFMIGPGRIPGSGVFCDIRELEPGCYGYFYCGKWNWRRYWRLTDAEHTDSFEETAEKVRYLVDDAITAQMVSDVPIGTFLSGGLDSSLISAICGKRMQSRGQQLSTFSVDYADNDRYFTPGKFQPDSDNAYIEIMTDYIASYHRTSVLTPEQLSEGLDLAVEARDLPGMADVDSSLLVFCSQMRKHVKVALSGECADEIFGGYPWYRDPAVRAVNGFPWAQNLRERSGFLLPEITQRIDPYEYVNDQYRTTLNQCDILPGTSDRERRMKEMVNLNHRWFMQTLLDRKDRMSMYSGLEVRVPFCDYRIAAYLYTVPWDFKDYQGREKGLLRYAMRDYLPEKVLRRKKSPYPKTHDPKYFQLVRTRLQQVMDDPDAPILQLVSRQQLEKLLTAEFEWPWYGQLMREPQTVAYMLQVNHWLTKYRVALV